MSPSVCSTPLPLPSQVPRMPNLPWELILDILSRLPATSLLRFRCVSKPWRSLIDSPDFVQMHLRQSQKAAGTTNRSLILGFLGIYSIDLDSLDCARPLRPPFSSSDVSNSCNGLVLLLGQNQTPFLWNPCTRKYKTLPDSPHEYPPPGIPVDYNALYKRYGFGYVAQDDDYKVLRVVEFRSPDSTWIGSEAKIYSLKTNSWRRVDHYPFPLPRIRGWGVHVNGAVHTVLSLDNYYQEIVAFDLRTEKHYTIPKPDLLLENVELSVDEMAGCLCLLVRKKRRINIWIMKEYHVKSSWTKLLSIAPPLIDEHCSLISPLAYSRRGDEVLLNCDDEKLVWYDLMRKTTRDVDVQGLPFRFYAEFFVGSLLPLENGCRGGGGGEDEIGITRRATRQKNTKVNDTRKKRDDFLSKGFKLVL
ncbi:F-box protein CPR1 [Coffea arabica]|nr:F-box protein CPR1-like [Coffea arabica]